MVVVRLFSVSSWRMEVVKMFYVNIGIFYRFMLGVWRLMMVVVKLVELSSEFRLLRIIVIMNMFMLVWLLFMVSG